MKVCLEINDFDYLIDEFDDGTKTSKHKMGGVIQLCENESWCDIDVSPEMVISILDDLPLYDDEQGDMYWNNVKASIDMAKRAIQKTIPIRVNEIQPKCVLIKFTEGDVYMPGRTACPTCSTSIATDQKFCHMCGQAISF